MTHYSTHKKRSHRTRQSNTRKIGGTTLRVSSRKTHRTSGQKLLDRRAKLENRDTELQNNIREMAKQEPENVTMLLGERSYHKIKSIANADGQSHEYSHIDPHIIREVYKLRHNQKKFKKTNNQFRAKLSNFSQHQEEPSALQEFMKTHGK